MRRCSSERQRLAARESFLEPVPVRDFLLPEVPAEADLDSVAKRGEVDQATLGVLDLGTLRMDPLDAASELAPRAIRFCMDTSELARRDSAAVPGDTGECLRTARLGCAIRLPSVHHLLDERTHLRQRRVRLLGCEIALGHPGMIQRVVSAGQRVRQTRAPIEKLQLSRAPNPALEIFLWSRLAIWAAAVFAFLWFEPNRHPDADRWDNSFFHDLGWLTDVWARWDSGWFLQIAERGYTADAEAAPAFFPLYPALVGGLGRVLAGHYVVAGVAVSLTAAFGAFLLLHRLAEERLGADGARRTVLYLAVFPMSLFLQAVYSESLFLLLAVAAFLLAERRRWLGVAALAGLALLTRPAALALLPALALIAWRSGERRRAFASLTLAPALFALYPLWLQWRVGDALAFARAQHDWNRSLSLAGPLGGVWDGVHAVATGAVPVGAVPFHARAVNLQGLIFLALFVGLTVVAWRRFGAPYGLFAALSLAVPLSVPSERWPLLSLPRFGLVVFPFFLALAVLGGRPRIHTAIVGISALFLGVAVTQWALWQWVA